MKHSITDLDLNVPLGVTAGNTFEGCTSGITSSNFGGGYPFNSPYRCPGRGFIGGQGTTPPGSLSARISIFVNAQEDLHKKWFGTVSGSEKNHLVYYTGTFGCSADGGYPTYTGP